MPPVWPVQRTDSPSFDEANPPASTSRKRTHFSTCMFCKPLAPLFSKLQSRRAQRGTLKHRPGFWVQIQLLWVWTHCGCGSIWMRQKLIKSSQKYAVLYNISLSDAGAEGWLSRLRKVAPLPLQAQTVRLSLFSLMFQWMNPSKLSPNPSPTSAFSLWSPWHGSP